MHQHMTASSFGPCAAVENQQGMHAA